MNILVTGAYGFVGKNLVATLKTIKEGKNKTTKLPINLEICEFDIDTDKALLEEYCIDCDFVVNLAGVNRPETEEEFAKAIDLAMEGCRKVNEIQKEALMKKYSTE